MNRDREVRSLVNGYEKEFGVDISHRDARHMIKLYEELYEIFAHYLGDDDLPDGEQLFGPLAHR